MSRQQLRRTRLLELEKEQHIEDAEGLFMTEEQRQSLLDSFMSVKLEFHDLDGLRWTQTALKRRQHTRRPTIIPTNSSNWPLLVQTSPTFDLDATIRELKHGRRNPVVNSPHFWNDDPEIDTLALGFPLPPRTIPDRHVKDTTSIFTSGLGLIGPVIKENHNRITPRIDTGFFYDAITYTHLSPCHSPQWTSQAW